MALLKPWLILVDFENFVIIAASTKALRESAPRSVDDLIASGHWKFEKRAERIAFIRDYYGDDNSNLRLHAVKNATIFGHQLLLAGHSVGLGGFWLGGFDEAKVLSEFCAPEDYVIAGIVGFGWPKGGEIPQARLPLSDVIAWERW